MYEAWFPPLLKKKKKKIAALIADSYAVVTFKWDNGNKLLSTMSHSGSELNKCCFQSRDQKGLSKERFCSLHCPCLGTHGQFGESSSKNAQVALAVKNLPASAADMRRGLDPWVGKIPWRRAWQPTMVILPGESHTVEPGGLTVRRITKSQT